MAVKSSDKLLLACAALLFAASGAAIALLVRLGIGLQPPPVGQVQLAEMTYTASVAEPALVKTETWPAPAPQKRGREWIYDTFTPPEIFYNPRTKQFTVKPPTAAAEAVEEPFGLELIAVRPEPFRLQLIGYVGDRGTFENTLTGEVFLGAAGKRVPALGLTIVGFDVRLQPIALRDSMTTQQRVATAVVRDEKTGRDVTITHRERHFTGTVSAFVAAEGANAAREVRSGDGFKLGAATYRVEKVQLTPPQIEVTKEAPTLPQPERRTLVPREGDAPEKPDGQGS